MVAHLFTAQPQWRHNDVTALIGLINDRRLEELSLITPPTVEKDNHGIRARPTGCIRDMQSERPVEAVPLQRVVTGSPNRVT